jgi:predicted nucleic acid-binding protein
MLYLDNDILAKYARPDPDPNVVHYLKQHRSEPWGISAIVAYEFLSYYEQSAQQRQLHQLQQHVVDEISPFDTQTALEAANLRRALAQTKASLDTGDLLVAATAHRHGGTLATANRNDFDKPQIRQLIDVEIVELA